MASFSDIILALICNSSGLNKANHDYDGVGYLMLISINFHDFILRFVLSS